MSITPVQDICPKNKWDIKCPYSMNATRIVIHNTANDASAKNEISYMNTNNNKVSFHFAIDDKEVRQGLPLDRNGWHAGDGRNGKGNREGIAIEICYSKSGGDRFIKAEQLAAKFTAQLLNERNWGIEKMTKHQDYSGKYCPHRTLDMGWQRFVNMVIAEMKQPEPTPTPTPAGDYEVVVTLKGYATAADALKGTNPKSIVNPGKYFVYKKSGDAINVTKSQGTPGSWVDSRKNTVTPTPDKLNPGTELNLNKVNLYSSSSSSRRSTTVTGTYYVWSSEVVNNKIRITRPYANVGKSGQVTGWINYSDAKASVVSKPTTSTPTPVTPTPSTPKPSNPAPSTPAQTTFKIGDKVRFNSAAKYWATGQKIPAWVKLQRLYVRSTPSNGRCSVSILSKGAITGVAKVSDLYKV